MQEIDNEWQRICCNINSRPCSITSLWHVSRHSNILFRCHLIQGDRFCYTSAQERSERYYWQIEWWRIKTNKSAFDAKMDFSFISISLYFTIRFLKILFYESVYLLYHKLWCVLNFNEEYLMAIKNVHWVSTHQTA